MVFLLHYLTWFRLKFMEVKVVQAGDVCFVLHEDTTQLV